MLAISYSYCRTDPPLEKKEMFNKLLQVVSMESNEHSLTVKLTFLLAVAFQATDIKVVPFVMMSVPQIRRGHPYEMDLLFAKGFNNSMDDTTTTSSTPITTLAHGTSRKVIAVVEIKKSVSRDFKLVESSAMIELILYVRYMMTLTQCNKMMGILTDGSSWHCLEFTGDDSVLLNIKRYVSFCGTEIQIIGTVPQLFNHYLD